MQLNELRLVRPPARAVPPWEVPGSYWPALDAATAQLDAPLGVISVPALAYNAFDMLDRARGKPIRVASKSVRVRGVLDAVLELPGYSGVLAYTLAEAVWLATTSADGNAIDDVVVGYPSADRAAIRRLAHSARLCSRVTIMVDSIDQLDFIDSIVAPKDRSVIRVCVELDASWRNWLLGSVGVSRSPVHSVAEMRELAEAIVERRGFRLVGLMGYEAQIAGVGDELPGRRFMQSVIRGLQGRSVAEIAERRAAAVATVRSIVDLEFVNGGGTGSIESTVAEDAVTEVAAGSGLFGPHLFDHYRAFTPAPAASFALSVVRKPQADTATLLGGGWVASGPPAADRVPQIAWPVGLTMLPREMAGEVQTPVKGQAATALSIGDRVWLRHTKAGELSEHLNEFALVDGPNPAAQKVLGFLPTYRGSGKAFL
jgi:D-serine deaminase-like pyridoxal phosphate-dependent protein